MDGCYIPNNPTTMHYLGLEFQEPLLGTAPSTPPSHLMVQLNNADMAPSEITPDGMSSLNGSAEMMWGFVPDDMMTAAAISADNATSYNNSPSPVTTIDFEDTVTAAVHNFFPFSPCCSSSNDSTSSNCNRNDFIGCFIPRCDSSEELEEVNMKQSGNHEMSDVLVSLKHSIIHSGQGSAGFSNSNSEYFHNQQFSYSNANHNSNNNQCSFNTGPASTSLSYTIYPHQITPIPIGDNYENIGSQLQQYTPPCLRDAYADSAVVGPTGCGNSIALSTNHFHAMSVNVSMNMTMHGCSATGPQIIQHQENMQHPLQCHSQMQWTSLTPTLSPVYQSQQILSPINNSCNGSNSGYSFNGDFKPQNHNIDDNFFSQSNSLKKSPYPQLSPNMMIKCNKKYTNNYNNNNNHHDCAAAAEKQLSNIFVTECDLGKPNLCRICGKTYARPSTLKTHLRTHSGEKPYRCEGCNKSFSQAANLTAHVRTHSGEKPFCCPICDRRFSQSSSVTTHMRTHSGERPYRCRMCKKAFSDSSTLTKHLRIHSGEKPYQCKLCLLRFSQSGNLNRHMRVHSIAATNLLLP